MSWKPQRNNLFEKRVIFLSFNLSFSRSHYKLIKNLSLGIHKLSLLNLKFKNYLKINAIIVPPLLMIYSKLCIKLCPERIY